MPSTTENDPLNILLIGETGSGKTTLVNSFANYSRYSTLDEAIDNGSVVLADVGFTYSGAGGRREFFKGSNSGTELVDDYGMTHSQASTTYTIGPDDSDSLLFYDTPGFGSQSTEQVNRVTKPVHAICVVLRSGETRLHPELRTFLTKEANCSRNFIYVFTNTRGDHCQAPASLFHTLKDFLRNLEGPEEITLPNKENVFCFENDCFRHLCCSSGNSVNNGLLPKAIAKEWNWNVKEFRRLISHVKTFTPISCVEQDVSSRTEEENEIKSLIDEVEAFDTSSFLAQNLKLSPPRKDQLPEPLALITPFWFFHDATEDEMKAVHETILSKQTPALKRSAIQSTLKRRSWQMFENYVQAIREQIRRVITVVYRPSYFGAPFSKKDIELAVYRRLKEELSDFEQKTQTTSGKTKQASTEPSQGQSQPELETEHTLGEKKPPVYTVLLFGKENSEKEEFINGLVNYWSYKTQREASFSKGHLMPGSSFCRSSIYPDCRIRRTKRLSESRNFTVYEIILEKKSSSKIVRSVRLINTNDMTENTGKKEIANILKDLENIGDIHAVVLFQPISKPPFYIRKQWQRTLIEASFVPPDNKFLFYTHSGISKLPTQTRICLYHAGGGIDEDNVIIYHTRGRLTDDDWSENAFSTEFFLSKLARLEPFSLGVRATDDLQSCSMTTNISVDFDQQQEEEVPSSSGEQITHSQVSPNLQDLLKKIQLDFRPIAQPILENRTVPNETKLEMLRFLFTSSELELVAEFLNSTEEKTLVQEKKVEEDDIRAKPPEDPFFQNLDQKVDNQEGNLITVVKVGKPIQLEEPAKKTINEDNLQIKDQLEKGVNLIIRISEDMDRLTMERRRCFQKLDNLRRRDSSELQSDWSGWSLGSYREEKDAVMEKIEELNRFLDNFDQILATKIAALVEILSVNGKPVDHSKLTIDVRVFERSYVASMAQMPPNCKEFENLLKTVEELFNKYMHKAPRL